METVTVTLQLGGLGVGGGEKQNFRGSRVEMVKRIGVLNDVIE